MSTDTAKTTTDGQAATGDRVSYEDMANPRRVGTVVEVIERGGTTPSGMPLPTGREYRVVFDDPEDGETVSDLRQCGWKRLPAPEQTCAGCGQRLGIEYKGGSRDFCGLCVEVAGRPKQKRRRHFAAVRLYRALRLDPLACAYGVNDSSGAEFALWDERKATESGWSTGPTLVWEGGPFEWAIAVTGGDSLDSDYRGGLGSGIKAALADAHADGVYFEPVNSFMLCVYDA